MTCHFFLSAISQGRQVIGNFVLVLQWAPPVSVAWDHWIPRSLARLTSTVHWSVCYATALYETAPKPCSRSFWWVRHITSRFKG
ncbi:hypothetical protein F4805DRAFT_421872 [Annulohypoxylon moriforme]|nr:hypothetical protein F4805DRAFT_421872 [Annulohypoxylon moriforme]